jgi:hypothetical protein
MIHNAQDMHEMQRAAQKWAEDENEDWDGHLKSYDVVMLLTGKKFPGNYYDLYFHIVHSYEISNQGDYKHSWCEISKHFTNSNFPHFGRFYRNFENFPFHYI